MKAGFARRDISVFVPGMPLKLRVMLRTMGWIGDMKDVFHGKTAAGLASEVGPKRR